MNRAPVSVVIPTYNSATLVTQAVDSVLAQTAPPEEVIVVDDGSRDDTQRRLGAYGDRIVRVVQENQGVAAARNQGIRRARQEFVAFLDADDVWHPRKLELQLAALARRPDLGLLGTGYFDWPAPAFPDLGPAPEAPLLPVPLHRLVIKNYFGTSSMMVRRRLVEHVGEFDTTLRGPEDYDFWLRLVEKSAGANLPLPLLGYRNVPGSLSKQAFSMEDGMRRILRKLDARGVWRGNFLLRSKAYSYCHCSCAYMHRKAGNRKEALTRLLRSLASYPFPYRRDEVRQPLLRATLLLACLRGV